MSASQAIANYESLSILTGQMLETALLGEWDKLITIEQQCSELIGNMKLIDADAQLDEAMLQHKAKLINKILTDEAEVRKHTQVWMDELQGILLSIEQSNRQEQRLQNTYGV